MEEKQLDFNAPLMSVRRFTSTTALNTEDSKRVEKFLPKKPPLPSYKPELKSGPVRNPGAVPFLWEQIPGRPKDGSGLRPNNPELHPLVPKLPPGITVGAKHPSSAKSTEEKEPEAFTVIKPLQNDNFKGLPDVFSSNGNETSLDRSKRDCKEEHTPTLEDHNDDAFSDAPDTLSHTESFSMNCSLSGLSSLDGLELKPSRSTSIDPQAWDFMMDRFLPAAKAMASESPQYASRKQPMAREPVRLVRQVYDGDGDRQPLFGDDRQPLHHQYRPYALPQHSQAEVEEASGDDEEDYDLDNLTAKACGVLPQFCLKNSLCLLNPVPGMKIQSQMPLSSVRHKAATQIKNNGPESLRETDPEKTWEAVFKHKLVRGIQPPAANDDGSKPTSESRQLLCWSDSQTLDASSPCRHSSGDGITPYRNEAPLSLFHEGIGFLGVPNQRKNCKADDHTVYGEGHITDLEMLSHQSCKRESGSLSPTIEKTLYIDSVHVLETSNSRSSSSDGKELVSFTEKDAEFLAGNERLPNSLTFVDGLGEPNHVKCFKARDRSQPKIYDTSESYPLSCSEGSVLGVSMDNGESRRHNDGLVQEAKSLECSKALTNPSLGIDRSEHLEEEDPGDSYAISSQSPLPPGPPPLPKSPSESWLCRTLPSVSSMNLSSRSYLGVQFHSKRHLLKEPQVDSKWETIVKTTNAQHNHLRFSEELKITAHHPSETWLLDIIKNDWLLEFRILLLFGTSLVLALDWTDS
ncbi:hypothetical protein AAC387_Pa05g0122 [Persea americana]